MLKKETEILSSDIEGTIDFLKNECTEDEYSWISEVIGEVIKKTQSVEILNTYKALKFKYPEENKKFYVDGMVEAAEYELL